MRQSIYIAFVILLAKTALADYHYVSHEGSDEWPYTSWETAALVIQDAVDAAEAGDTVFVGEGTWTEQTQIWDNSLALIGMGIGNTILENYETTQIRIYSDTVLIEGFSFISHFEIDPSSGISSLEWGYLEIKNNYFYGNAAGVSGNMGGQIKNNFFEYNWNALRTAAIKRELVFENNTIYHNRVGPSVDVLDLLGDTSRCYIRKNFFYEGDSQGGIFWASPTYNVDTTFIHNNVIYKKIDTGGQGHGSFGYTNNRCLFFNNTIDGTSEGDNFPYWYITGIKSQITDTLRTIDNNIVVNCEVGVWQQPDVTVEVRYSDFFNISEDYFHGPGVFGEGSIFTDPMFVDTLDFHLQAFSPAIDAGNPEILDPDGSRSDMGAYGGPYGESYDYPDLPPKRPDSLVAEVSAGLDTIYLFWRFNTEADFDRYQLHRDTLSGFTPDVFNLIAEPESSIFIDTDFDLAHSYYYRIAAFDNQGNISEYSEELGVVFTGFGDSYDPNLPRVAVLYQNYPNPFNISTIIEYYLPDIGFQPAEVRLEIYDLLGRLVRRLVDERQYPGEYSVTWDGRDDRGNRLPSGVYFCRLFVFKAELSKPRKLILMK